MKNKVKKEEKSYKNFSILFYKMTVFIVYSVFKNFFLIIKIMYNNQNKIDIYVSK